MGEIIHIDAWGAGPFVIEHLGKTFRFEDSDRFGPIRLKKDGEPAENQFFAEKSPFWYAWEKWVGQGRRLSDDGVTCVWSHDPQWENAMNSMSEWIEHDGRGMPVGPFAKVEVRMRSGDETTGFPDDAPIKKACALPWAHSGSLSDIIAYRVVKP